MKMLFGTKKNLLTLVVLSIAVIGMYMKSFFLYLSEKEKYVPEPKSLFIVTDAVNGYGLDLTTIIAKENFHVLGVVRTLDDAEFLRSSGLGKVDTLVWTNEPHVTNDTFSLARNELIASLASYNALNISVSGIVVTLTPQHFYDKAGPSEMDGFEFSIETVKEVLTSIAMIQQVSREFNSKSMRIVLVAPYAPSTFLTDPRSLNSTEIAEMVIMRSLEAAVHEVRSHLASEGFSVSILYSPSRHTPSETFWQRLWSHIAFIVTLGYRKRKQAPKAGERWSSTQLFLHHALHALRSARPYAVYRPHLLLPTPFGYIHI